MPSHRAYQQSGKVDDPQVAPADCKAVIQIGLQSDEGNKKIGCPPPRRTQKAVEDSQRTSQQQTYKKAPELYSRGHQPISRRHREPAGRGSS